MWIVATVAGLVLVAGDVLLWLGVGWVPAGQPQAAMIAAASALPVALVGIVGSMLGAWRTHVGLLDRERLVRFQAERLDACVKVLTFVDEYLRVREIADEFRRLNGQSSAEMDAREEKIRRDLFHARSTLAVLGVADDLGEKVKILTGDVLDGKPVNESRSAFVAAVRTDLRI